MRLCSRWVVPQRLSEFGSKFCSVLLSRASTRSGLVELLLVCVLAPLGASSVSFVGFGVLFWVLLSLSYSSQVRGSVVLSELLLGCVLALLGSSSVFLGDR